MADILRGPTAMRHQKLARLCRYIDRPAVSEARLSLPHRDRRRGEDAVFGGAGDDALFGGGGPDHLFGDLNSSLVPFDWTLGRRRSHGLAPPDRRLYRISIARALVTLGASPRTLRSRR